MGYHNQGTEEILYDTVQNEIFHDIFISRKLNDELTSAGRKFKRDFIREFTKAKMLSKVIVERIHRYIGFRIDIPHFKREHRRRIALYFNEFAKYYNIIIPFIRQHKNEILEIL